MLGFCSPWKIEIRKISLTSMLWNVVVYLDRSIRNYWLLQIILLLGFWNNILSWFSSCLTGYSCLISSAVLPHLPNLSILDCSGDHSAFLTSSLLIFISKGISFSFKALRAIYVLTIPKYLSPAAPPTWTQYSCSQLFTQPPLGYLKSISGVTCLKSNS